MADRLLQRQEPPMSREETRLQLLPVVAELHHARRLVELLLRQVKADTDKIEALNMSREV